MLSEILLENLVRGLVLTALIFRLLQLHPDGGVLLQGNLVRLTPSPPPERLSFPAMRMAMDEVVILNVLQNQFSVTLALPHPVPSHPVRTPGGFGGG